MHQIELAGVPWHRESIYYDLIYRNKAYPPKYVISLAAKFAHGAELAPNKFNAIEARNYLVQRGFTIRKRNTSIQDEDDEATFPEGQEKYGLHRFHERNGKLVIEAKRRRLEETGTLACEVCGFDFRERYGEIGEGFVEAHHITPVSKLTGKTENSIENLAMVCSNCHRMLHRSEDTITGLRERIIAIR